MKGRTPKNWKSSKPGTYFAKIKSFFLDKNGVKRYRLKESEELFK